MIDPPTPAGYVADAEEALGKARAMRDQAETDRIMWQARICVLIEYRDDVLAWADAGGKGKRPRKPKFDIE